jgi:hypothetical protein
LEPEIEIDYLSEGWLDKLKEIDEREIQPITRTRGRR